MNASICSAQPYFSGISIWSVEILSLHSSLISFIHRLHIFTMVMMRTFSSFVRLLAYVLCYFNASHMHVFDVYYFIMIGIYVVYMQVILHIVYLYAIYCIYVCNDDVHTHTHDVRWLSNRPLLKRIGIGDRGIIQVHSPHNTFASQSSTAISSVHDSLFYTHSTWRVYIIGEAFSFGDGFGFMMEHN